MNLSRITDRIKFKASTVYNYLNNPINYESILIDEISEFSVINENSFAIKIGSLPKISLEHNSNVFERSTSLKSNNEKLSFVFNFKVNEIDESSCNIEIHFMGEFSSMMQMMIKPPMNKFLDAISKKVISIDFSK
tara:strand:- start:15301 stop:15705 length:405 start_codon:yes stop_codon:yes gene_type:complete